MQSFKTQAAADFLHAALESAGGSILEMAMDLSSGRVDSVLSESELEGIYFNLQLYREALEQTARTMPITERRFRAVDSRRVDPNQLRGHVRTCIALRYAVTKIELLLGQDDLTAEERQMLHGLDFGIGATLATFDAALEYEPELALVAA
jgi:hypothetical protein